MVAALRGGEESKAEGMGKGGWETILRGEVSMMGLDKRFRIEYIQLDG